MPIPTVDLPERRRSLGVPLFWMGAAAFFAFPVVRDATADPMLRNQYRDLSSCQCDYGNRCSWNRESNGWVGPWYARRASDRQPDDPGWGACYTNRGTALGYAGGGARYDPPKSTEAGYRGGFGGTGRVRAAGS